MACFSRARNLDLLKQLRNSDCPWDEWTSAYAAHRGHPQWARLNGCPWDENTCSRAARNGHLDVLQWAIQNGCPWNEETCTYAARYGHLETLRCLMPGLLRRREERKDCATHTKLQSIVY